MIGFMHLITTLFRPNLHTNLIRCRMSKAFLFSFLEMYSSIFAHKTLVLTHRDALACRRNDTLSKCFYITCLGKYVKVTNYESICSKYMFGPSSVESSSLSLELVAH